MKASGATSEKPNIDFLSRYIPMPAVPPMPLPNGADLTRLWDARDLAADAEAFFQK